MLFAVNNYPPHSGGVEQHVAQLAAQLVADGHRVTVVTLSDQQTDSIEAGVRVIRERRHGNIGDVLSFPRPGAAHWLAKLIQREHVDIVSVHTRFFPMTWAGVRAARSAGVPCVLTEHGSAHVRGVSATVAAASRIVDWTFGRRALRQATLRLAVSADAARFVEQLSGRTARVFPNAIDVSFWRLGSEQPTQRFVFVGRLVPGKGWLEAVEAFELAAAGAPGFELHLIGDGPGAGVLRDRVRRSPVSARIVVHGRMAHDEIRQLLARQWLVNPTSLAEGFQTTLLEAAVAGAGIISYPAPGLVDISASGASVRVASSVDELTALLVAASKIKPNKLRDRDAEQWGWPVRARQYAELAEGIRKREVH